MTKCRVLERSDLPKEFEPLEEVHSLLPGDFVKAALCGISITLNPGEEAVESIWFKIISVETFYFETELYNQPCGLSASPGDRFRIAKSCVLESNTAKEASEAEAQFRREIITENAKKD